MHDPKSFRASIRPTNHAKTLAKSLRSNLSPPEKILWALLKGNKLDHFHFRTQVPLGPYIADFYCHQARLVIEIDGKEHQGERLIRDAQRDQWMNERGLEVLRVQARDVFENLDGVIGKIRIVVERRFCKLKAELPDLED